MSGRAIARIRAGHEVLLWGGGGVNECGLRLAVAMAWCFQCSCVVIALSRVARGGLDWLIWLGSSAVARRDGKSEARRVSYCLGARMVR